MQFFSGFRGCQGIPFLLWLAAVLVGGRIPCQATVYTVTSTADSGTGTLRAALTAANLNALLPNPGVQNIDFALTTPPYTITLASALPAALAPVIIDGTTQPGYVSQPIVQLNGNNVASTVGLSLAAGASTVQGLVLNHFTSYALQLNGASNTIAGNWIGTDTNGVLSLGNRSYGIYVTSSGNVIGGTNAANRNVICGNTVGIYLSGAGNMVLGNWIGINASNGLALGNTNSGIQISGAGNVIGGTNAGAANVISGNKGSGIYLYQAGASNNVVSGNFIGTDITGGIMVSNANDGITINGPSGNLIGPGNVISGNGSAGVNITTNASFNTVVGNLIGTDVTGSVALRNFLSGISINNGNANQIGGANAGAGNVISGNLQHGIQLTGGTLGNSIQGNLIGVNASGTSALANGANGITLSGSSSNLIGGTVGGARNLVSGNGIYGINIQLATDSGNQVQGNYIGTDITGTKAVPNNGSAGVYVQGNTNLFGGTSPGAGNVISGNAMTGIYLAGASGSLVRGNVIQGNLIGLDVRGTNALPNGAGGIGLFYAVNSQIGGTTAAARNVISANKPYGIFIESPLATNNTIQGNYIGTDITGGLARGNTYEGIYIQDSSRTQIGGTTPGAGNLISGNDTVGIWFTNTTLNVIQGNYIGTDVTGTNNLSNGEHNLDFEANSSANIVGGTNALAGNLIAYAPGGFAGVRIRVGSQNILISGNSIFGNSGLGITLGVNFEENANVDCESGVAANAANAWQNYPVITNVICNPGTTLIRGYLDSGTGKTYQLQFFANPAVDPSGYGQGQVYLGTTTLTLGSTCTSNFTALLPVSVPAGWAVSATATDPNNNTSEFSADDLAANPPPIHLALAGPSYHSITNSKGNPATYVTYTNALISFTNGSGPFTLQQTFSLTPPVNWIAATNPLVLSNGNYSVVSPAGLTNVFYRLTAP